MSLTTGGALKFLTQLPSKTTSSLSEKYPRKPPSLIHDSILLLLTINFEEERVKSATTISVKLQPEIIISELSIACRK
jgi:hypothetical protein